MLGGTTGATDLTIYGTRFVTGATSVTSNVCVNGSVLLISSTELRCTLKGGNGTVVVNVTAAGGSSIETGFTIKYYNLIPSITSLAHTGAGLLCSGSGSIKLSNCPVVGTGKFIITGNNFGMLYHILSFMHQCVIVLCIWLYFVVFYV